MRDDVLRGDLAITNRHEHGFRVGKVQLVGDTHQCFRSQQRGDWQVALAHGARQLVTAFLDGFGTAFLAEPLTNLVACLGLLAKLSQSRDGPADSDLDVNISTVSPFSSLVSSGTNRPFTRAPMVR